MNQAGNTGAVRPDIPSEELYRQILFNTRYLMGLLDIEGTLLFANPTALKLIECRAEEVVGRPFWDTPWWTHSAAEQERLRQAIAQARSGADVILETTHPAAAGALRWVEFMLHPIRDDDGTIRYLLPESRDITDRKLAENELREARRLAELADRAKSELLANTSHELRTPLNSILGFTDILAGDDGRMPLERRREFLKVIGNAASHLLRLINDILDMAAVEAGRVTLDDHEVQLPEAIFAAVRVILPRAAEKHIVIMPRFEPGLPTIRGDETRIKQILLNLLSNAVKFTALDGLVSVEAERLDDGGIAVAVRDNGIGMDPEGIARARRPFEQLDVAPNRLNCGTGLGLPLAIRLAELHDGRLEVDSTVGVGTCVTVYFPPSRVLA